MTTLNATFECKLASEDEGYESSSENFNIPTPLRRTSKIHHVSSFENASFDPIPVTPCSTRESQLRPLCRRLTYSPSDDDVDDDDDDDDDDDASADEIPLPYNTSPVQLHTPDL